MIENGGCTLAFGCQHSLRVINHVATTATCSLWGSRTLAARTKILCAAITPKDLTNNSFY